MTAVRMSTCVVMCLVAFVPLASGLTPEEMAEIRATTAKAIAHFSKGEYDLALPLMEEVLRMDPEDRTAKRYLLLFNAQVMEPYCKIAVDAYLEGNYPEAITQWERVLELNPDNRNVGTLIEETVALQADDAIESYCENASRFLRKGEHERAAFELEKILIINPDDDRARQMLLTARRMLVDNSVREHYARADEYLESKQYELALAEWRKILDIDPSQKLASRMVANAYRQTLDDSYAQGRGLYKNGDCMAARDTFNKPAFRESYRP